MRFEFTEAGNRELPQIVGQLPVLPKHWWTGKDPNGRQRDINATTLEPPLGSGPYRIANVRPGASITLARVADYWGKDLPVNIGAHNVDEITAIYFADETVMLEAFKGDAYDFRNENSAKNWATGYDVPAVRRGAIKREEVTLKNPEGMQCFCSICDAPNSPIRASALPSTMPSISNGPTPTCSMASMSAPPATSPIPSWRSPACPAPASWRSSSRCAPQLPPEVFTTPYANPVNANAQQRRQNLLKARNLLAEAGWKVAGDHILRNAAGEPMQVEFLLVSPTFERIVLPYVEQLKLLGVRSGVRTIDSAQYERRMQSFDFDIAVVSWPKSLSPGNEQRNFWSSEAAGRQGSQNYAGIKNPAVDKLVDRIIFAKSRQELVDACRALDRVLLWNQYVVPMWHLPYERLAFWDRFGRPRSPAALCRGISDNLVVGRGQGRGNRGKDVRRLAFAVAALATLMLGADAGFAQPRHGWSIFGVLKYPSGFDHFDYVNPDAPRGGRIATIGTSSVNTFDSLNGYILRGDAAQRLDLLFDSLMVRATDEPDAMYGLVASTIDVADDKSSAIFALRPEARFADGTPLTADDVVETFRLLKEHGHENIRTSIRDVASCEALDKHTVKYAS